MPWFAYLAAGAAVLFAFVNGVCGLVFGVCVAYRGRAAYHSGSGVHLNIPYLARGSTARLYGAISILGSFGITGFLVYRFFGT